MHGMYPEDTLQKIVTDKNTRRVWEHWLDYLEDDGKYSPDAFKVQQYEEQKVFLPDVFKKNSAGNLTLKEFGKYLCPLYTKDQYTFWEKKLPWGPFIPLEPVANQDKRVYGEPAHIMGELWSVPPKYIFNLDRFYKNGVEFVRKRVEFIHRTRNLTPPKGPNRIVQDPVTGKYSYDHSLANLSDWEYNTVKAWMYVGINSFWDPLLDAGFMFQPVKRYIPKAEELRLHIPSYYFYSEKHTE